MTKDRVTTLSELPQAIEPGRDLWPQIEARISGRDAAAPLPQAPVSSRRSTPWRWLAAAAMVGALAVGVWIGRSVLPGAGPPSLAQTIRPAAATLPVAWVSDPRYQRPAGGAYWRIDEGGHAALRSVSLWDFDFAPAP